MRILAVVLLLPVLASAFDDEVARSVRLEAGVRRLKRPLRVVADGIELDLGEAVLEGAAPGTLPDAFLGIGIIVEGRKNVTIRGGKLRGFRCAILIKDCENVKIAGVDVSGNFRQHLKSTPEREDPSDWLWPHKNDEQQWRKNYGAGICLENCRNVSVYGCTGRGQQNGIILDRCTGCLVYDNDMSFNSGWGIALWRSSRNLVGHNNFDWCVRGYSHGVYERGQDSAGILVFEQCNENSFIKNSATHGGDGFFLYAGHETLKKTGAGGCNDNVVFGNDFSHAVANAIEATFSRGNLFENNRCDDSNYGIWAGYSYETRIEGNSCRNNTYAGIGIEHGMDNEILNNTIEGNGKGIWLWWDDDKDLLQSAFANRHACRSEGYVVVGNVLRKNKVDVFLRDTSRVAFGRMPKTVSREGECTDITDGADYPREPPPLMAVVAAPGNRKTALPQGHPRGRQHILVDDWGPLDPRRAAVFPRRVVGWEACTFHVLGTDAKWSVEGLQGGLAVVEQGSRFFRVGGGPDGVHSFHCTVTIGDERFPVGGTLLNATWVVRFWKWEHDPRESETVWTKEPLRTERTRRLDYRWGNRGPAEDVPANRFATRARTKIVLEAGRYEIRTVSDDGVRVYVDGKKVLEDWTWHAPKEDRAVVELRRGEHEIIVEHFEIDGHAVLAFDMRPLR